MKFAKEIVPSQTVKVYTIKIVNQYVMYYLTG